MDKRTDRYIALGGIAVTAVVLPALLVALSNGGKHRQPDPTPAAAGQSDQPTVDPAQALPSSPSSGSTGASAQQNPDTTPGLQGKKPHMPPVPPGNLNLQKADDGATIAAVKTVGKYQFDITIATPSLLTEVQTRILVPKSWSANANRTWPVIYAYHGGNDNYRSWTVDTKNLVRLASGTDVMVVMPEGGWDGSYTNWYNGGQGGTPMWETFHTEEVIQLVERNFHAGGDRAAIGLSSGGQGSITYAERHPGMFKYAASFSGALNINGPGMPAALIAANSQPGVDPTAIWGDPATARNNWQAHDAAANVSKLNGIGVFVSAGNGQPGPYDDPNIAPWDAGRVGEGLAGRMTVNFVHAANDSGIPVSADLYGPGTHRWVYWDRELIKAWPSITAAIGAGRS
jgi:S-formylglutathione hydrolase FrmB